METYEQALIGAIILDQNAGLYAVRDNKITEKSFIDANCRTAFIAIEKLARAGRPIDIVTVEKALEAPLRGVTVSDMIDGTGAVSHVDHYASEVRDAERKRDMLEVLRVNHKLLNEDLPLDEALRRVQAALIELTDTNGVDVQTIGDLRQSKIDQWTRAQSDGFIGVPFTLPTVNRSLGGWRKGCVGIIAGYRGEGKSTLLRQQCLDLAKDGRKVALFTLEDPADIAAASMVGNHANISVFGLDTGRCNPGNLVQIDGEWKRLDIPLYIISGSLGINEIDSTSQLLKMKHGIDIVFIDHVQYITPLILKGMSRNDTMAHYSQRCSALSKKLDIPIVLASQLSRDSEKQNRTPKLSDLRDSGTLEQDARQILLLYYDGEADHHILEVAKNNFGESRKQIGVKRIDGRQRFEEVQNV